MTNNLENIKGKKIAFFGTPGFTVEFLKLFRDIGLDISLVVTAEDKPVGRGMQMHSPAPKVWAEQNPPTPLKGGTRVLQPKKLSEIETKLENFDLFIVIAYGKIISEKIINLPRYGTINLHYSLLPKYRGASPVESAILNGETETGITIQQMVYQLDAGPILYQEKINILPTDTTSELRDRMNKRAIEIFPEFLNNFFIPLPTSTFREGVTQNENDATSCGKFTKEDLDITKDIQNISLLYKKYKAFDKKICFFHTFTRNGETKNIRVKITEMNSKDILKVLPENKKEISKLDFENSFGKIF